MAGAEVGRATIIYKGYFDFQGLLDMVKKWMAQERFERVEKKFKQKGNASKLGMEVNWEGSKKASRYAKWEVSIVFKVNDAAETEIVKDGSKATRLKGEMDITLYGKVTTDWQGSFDKTETLKKAKQFYEKFMINADLGKQEIDALTKKVGELHKNIKAFLDMDAGYSAY